MLLLGHSQGGKEKKTWRRKRKQRPRPIIGNKVHMWSHPASRRAAVYAWRENVSCRFDANTHRARHNTHTYTHTYTPSHTYKSRVGPDDLEQKLKVSRWLCVKSAGGGLLKCGKLTVLCSCFWKCCRALWFIENVLTSRVDESICFALENDVQEGLKKKKESRLATILTVCLSILFPVDAF